MDWCSCTIQRELDRKRQWNSWGKPRKTCVQHDVDATLLSLGYLSRYNREQWEKVPGLVSTITYLNVPLDVRQRKTTMLFSILVSPVKLSSDNNKCFREPASESSFQMSRWENRQLWSSWVSRKVQQSLIIHLRRSLRPLGGTRVFCLCCELLNKNGA